jgi:hypothetical protein
VIDVRTACNEIEALLRAEVPLLQGFVGEIDAPIDTPPTLPGGQPDLRVLAYWVMWPGAGMLENRLVPGTFVNSLNFMVTVAGGTVDRALFGIGQVRAALAGTEIASGLITEQPFDPGNLRRDDSVTPSRQFLPLPYRLEP